jgi:hypothetical protein
VFFYFFGTIKGVFGCLWKHFSGIVDWFKVGNILARCRIDIHEVSWCFVEIL